MPDLHQHYDQLTDRERDFVDEVFSDAYPTARAYGVNLSKTDHAERAVDALARCVIESRPKPPGPKYGPPKRLILPTPTAAEKARALENDRNAFDKWAAEVRP